MSKDRKIKNKKDISIKDTTNSSGSNNHDHDNILSCLKKTDSDIKLFIQVKASAKKNSIEGIIEDRLKIKISSPPIDGKANEEIIKYLSKILDLKRSDIKISLGLSSKIKTVSLNTTDIIKINLYLLKELEDLSC